jgi:tetratricopeptide (TPR) repeat protein
MRWVRWLVLGLLFVPTAGWAQANVANLVQEAMKAANQRNWSEAARLYEQAIGLEPSNAALYNNLAVIRRRQGDIPGAIGAYQQALRLDPSLTEAYVNLGIALLLNQQWQQALTVLNQGEVRGYRDPVLFFYQGLAQERLENWGEAQRLYQLYTRARPQAFAFYRLAVAAWQNGRGSDALEAFRAAAQLDPSQELFRSEAGLALAKLGQNQEALEVLQGLSAAWPQATDFIVLARVAAQAQQWEVANQAIQQALNRRPNPELTLISDQAVIQVYQQGDPQIPLDLLQGVARTIPPTPVGIRRDYAIVLTNLAAVYVQQGNFEQARQTGEQAMAWDPDFAPAYNITAVALLGLEQPALAKDLLEAGLRKNDQAWQMHRNLGIAYALLGDRPAASQAWQIAFNKAPTVEIQRSLNDELVRLQQLQLPAPTP